MQYCWCPIYENKLHISHQVNQSEVNKQTLNPPNMLSISAFLSSNSTYSDNPNPNPSPNPNPNHFK